VKVDTLEHLIHWSSAVHQHLAEQLDTAAQRADDGLAKLFVEYTVTHERKLATQVAGVVGESDAKALQTWVYEWLEQPPKAPEAIVRVGSHEVDLDALGHIVFSAHNEIITLFHQLQTRAATPEVEELIARMVDIEEGHTRQMAQQLNRTRDM